MSVPNQSIAAFTASGLSVNEGNSVLVGEKADRFHPNHVIVFIQA